MKKVLILSRRDDRTTFDRKDSMRLGMENLTSGSLDYYFTDYEDLVFIYDGSELKIIDALTGIDIAEFDGLFLISWFKTKPLNDLVKAITQYAKYHNVPFANSEGYYSRTYSKLSQCVIAVLNNITTTPFVFSMDSDHLVKYLKIEGYNRRYILKAILASRGQDNYLIKDKQYLINILENSKNSEKYFIAQQYIENDGDYRIIVMGKEVSIVMHRKSQNSSHLNNTSQGGVSYLVEKNDVPQNVLDDCIKIAKLLRRQVTGVDMIKDKKSGIYYFLEGNNMPQLSTGTYVTEKMTALNNFLTNLTNQK